MEEKSENYRFFQSFRGTGLIPLRYADDEQRSGGCCREQNETDPGKLTANRFLGVLVGAGITAVIQSSSATTVMVVGFVNSGMMTLRQAVWIIMGANIGTTITGQLIALDVSAIAPLLAFLGVALVVFVKKQKVHHYGLILAGLGILFVGMDMMSTSMMPLRDSEAFVALMTKFSNPVLGILAGAIFTAVISLLLHRWASCRPWLPAG